MNGGGVIGDGFGQGVAVGIAGADVGTSFTISQSKQGVFFVDELIKTVSCGRAPCRHPLQKRPPIDHRYQPFALTAPFSR